MASNQNNSVSRASKALETALRTASEMEGGILREGDRIVLPQGTTISAAIEVLERQKKRELETVTSAFDLTCHPSDGLVAFYSAMKETFGSLDTISTEAWFGTIPGRSLTISVDYDETMIVPVGRCEVPGLPIVFNIQVGPDENDPIHGIVRVNTEYQRLYETLVKKIELLAKKKLREESIFRGKAINSRFEFINVKDFDPSRVVYSEAEWTKIYAQILVPIQHPKEWLAIGNGLKRGNLLYGRYGTGKTLTARVIAQQAVQNGWTFINVLPGDRIAAAINFARAYQPSVCFVEDIDAEAQSNRDDRVNEILNTIDGILSKDSQVITIMTTNNEQNITQGMLRPGRLDLVMELGRFDRDSLRRFIEIQATGLLDGELDMDAVWSAADNYVPAFVNEGVVKAKAYALARHVKEGLDPKHIKITSDDVVKGLNELRNQFDLMMRDTNPYTPPLEAAMAGIVTKSIIDAGLVRKEDLNDCATR